MWYRVRIRELRGAEIRDQWHNVEAESFTAAETLIRRLAPEGATVTARRARPDEVPSFKPLPLPGMEEGS